MLRKKKKGNRRKTARYRKPTLTKHGPLEAGAGAFSTLY
jgi:hypothetical protein